MRTPEGPRRARRHWRILGERRTAVEPLPPPLTGWVGGMPASLHLWPPDASPGHPEALRFPCGELAGYWFVLRLG